MGQQIIGNRYSLRTRLSDGAVEILGGRERRRRWGLEEKLRIVAETHQPGARTREVAARHDVYPSLLHTWRRQEREGRLASIQPANFVPVCVDATPPVVAGPLPSGNEVRTTEDIIEIVLLDGSRVCVGNAVSLPALRRVMTALRR
jgi:transposase